MKISCLMITTNIPSRLHLLDNNINSIEKVNQGFLDKKVLSIDMFKEHPRNMKVFQRYKDLGWDLVTGDSTGHRGMLNNILRGLKNITPTDYIFYVEDDIIIDKLPGRESLDCFNEEKIGFVCFSSRIAVLQGPSATTIPQKKKDFINDPKNYKRFGKDLFLIKQDFLRDNYYLNFPSAIIKDDLFRSLLDYASKNCHGRGIEIALTKSWFDLKLNDKYRVAIYVKPDTLEHLPMTLQEFYYMANMQFWSNNEKMRHPSINDRRNTIL